MFILRNKFLFSPERQREEGTRRGARNFHENRKYNLIFKSRATFPIISIHFALTTTTQRLARVQNKFMLNNMQYYPYASNCLCTHIYIYIRRKMRANKYFIYEHIRVQYIEKLSSEINLIQYFTIRIFL